MTHQLTAKEKEGSARYKAGLHWRETGEFNLNFFPEGSIERSAYMAEAHKISHENGELL